MASTIRIETACFTLLLIDPPSLVRRDDELTQERLGEPARIAGRQAVAQLVPLVAGGYLAQLLYVGGAIARGQLGGDGAERLVEAIALLLRIEFQAVAAVTGPDAGPVGHLGIVRPVIGGPPAGRGLHLQIGGVGLPVVAGHGGVGRRHVGRVRR